MSRVRVRVANPRYRRKVVALVRRHGLDRRKVYIIGYDGELATDGYYTGKCSGCSCDCTEGGCSHGCAGCSECGYTGKRRHYFPTPVLINGKFVRIIRKEAL